MTDLTHSLLWLGLYWLGYFFIHSLLASQGVKSYIHSRHPRWQHRYRLLYNIIAVLLLLPIAWIMYRYPGTVLWQWHGVAKWLANGLAIAAMGGIFWTFKYYDGQDFLGIHQFKTRSTQREAAFCLSPAHRFVRHPWYFLILVIIWTRDMDTSHLLSYTLITLYFVIGARLEEYKLVKLFGNVYRQYQLQVPGLIPRPWHFINTQDAEKLLSDAISDDSPSNFKP